MYKDLIFNVPKEKHDENSLKEILTAHPEIKFVSLVAIDLAGNDTDEKIPVKLFLEDIKSFLQGGVQTDGSSVALPEIASINNAKIDILADLDACWFVDYNYEHIDEITGNPTGTLRIPSFLCHDGIFVDSRHILKNAISNFKTNLMSLFKNHPEYLNSFNLSIEDIDDITCTSATELEFWVKTPNEKAETEELTTSQILQEQYWKKTKGAVRTSLEQALILMDLYGFEPEMGHKEVGGVRAKITESGNFTHVMEQLEVDWKYSCALQCADNELFVKTLVREAFRRNGLEVTFKAKPIDTVAGSGEHTHVSVILKLKNGKKVNLFTPTKKHFLSSFGYASLMGILKNYEVINPFVSNTTDSLKRLQPGFEAPVCIVTSIGHSVDVPSRNRTILVGVIRDVLSPLATRFELRSPNPHSNTYLVISALYNSMLDGITYAISNTKNEDDLLKELSKTAGEKADYLEENRAYRSEEDVFEYYSDSEREDFFGKAPRTVYENFLAFDNYKDKLDVLKNGDVFTDKLIKSFKAASLNTWINEIKGRTLNNYRDEIRSFKMIHDINKALDLDVARWMEIQDLRYYIMKDTYAKKSLFTRITDALISKDLETVSSLQIELDTKMAKLRNLYSCYKKNLLDI